MGKTKQQLIVDNNTSFPNNNANYITPAILRDFNRDMIDNTVNQDAYTTDSGSFNQRIGDLASWSSSLDTNFASQTEFNSYTQSNDAKVNAIIAATSSFIDSSVTASMHVSSSDYAENSATASLSRNVIISAINANQSTLPIGSVVRISGANGDNPNFNTASYDTETLSSNTLGILAHTAASGQSADITVVGKVIGVNTAGMSAGDLLYLSSSGQFTNVQPQAPLNIVTLGEVLRVQSQNGSIFVNVSNGWELNELHNVRITSAQQGDILVYEASSSLWKNVPSSSIAGTSDTGSLLTTASFSGNTLTFTKGDSSTFGVVIPDASGSTSDTGSLMTTASVGVDGTLTFTKGDGSQFNIIGLATTGSNVFTGTNTFTNGQTTFSSQILFDNNADLNNYSGSTWTFGLSGTTGSNYTLKSNPFEPVLLITRESDNAKPIQFDWRDNKVTLAESGSVEISPNATLFKSNTTSSFYGNAVWMIAEGFTSSLAFVTASVSGSDSNLIFKNNSLTTAVVVSGSSNIFQIPSAPTAGFTRYIGGGNNLLLTSASVPQLTGSTGIYPQFAGNISNTGAYTFRTPASSSAWTVTSNILTSPGGVNFGSAAGTSMVSASAGFAFGNNIVNAGVNITAYKTTLVSSPIISTNSLGGTVNINLDSSSIQLANTTAQGVLTINNSYSSSTASGNSLQITAGNIFVGTGNIIYASGSNTTLTSGRQIIGSAIFGSANSASVNLLGDNSSLIATTLIGHGLSITGSSLISTGQSTWPDRGTVIVGRFNAQAQSHNTVFAVGTGTSGSAGITRKTGLLIDSGSNTFIDGTLNITGSTSITGSLFITGGVAEGNFQFIPSDSALFAWNYNTDVNANMQVYAQTETGSISIKAYQTHTAITDTTGTDAIRFELDGSGVTVNQPLSVTGSVSITETLKLAPLDPLPTGDIGMLAVSGSSLYFYNGAWTLVI